MEIILIFISGVLAIFVSGYVTSSFFRWKKRHEIILHFEKYMTLLQYFMSKAYDIIHKDRILIYSIEAMKISESEFSVISYDYAKLVIKLMGPNIFEDFIFYYGNQDTLIFNLVEYFNLRYEDDEVRNAALENLTQSDQGEESIQNG